MRPLVRDSVPEDLAAIERIYAHHVRHGLASFEEIPPSREELARRRENLLSQGFPYLVAEAGEKVLGYSYAGPYRPRSAYRFSAENSVYVAPGAERRGIGRLLLETLIARCTAEGLRQMIAVIGDSANQGSIGLHAALGFRLVGTIEAVGFKHGSWVDSVLMQRPLGPGSSLPPEESGTA
jgi:L-amino acid N-acyltransferase YncA